MPKLSMGLRQMRIERQRTLDRRKRLRKYFVRSSATKHGKYGIGVRETRIREGECGISSDRLFQIAERFLQRIAARPRQAGPAGDVQLVGLGIVRRPFPQSTPLPAAEFVHQ